MIALLAAFAIAAAAAAAGLRIARSALSVRVDGMPGETFLELMDFVAERLELEDPAEIAKCAAAVADRIRSDPPERRRKGLTVWSRT